ncbi:hypothetical protein J6590_033536 [Homalodisca vitripennis]|nr:hypothetical protein J6590_033536 [Homalodisca vitripennis]
MEKNEEECIKKEGRFHVEALPSTSTVRDRDRSRRENTVGILRLDLGKPPRSSGSSVEFRNPVQLAAQISGTEKTPDLYDREIRGSEAGGKRIWNDP